MSDTMEIPWEGTRMVVELPGPVTLRIPVWTIWTLLVDVLSPEMVMNWSNSPEASAVVRLSGCEVTFVPFWRTTAVKFAWGTGMDARSVVRFWRREVSVSLRLSVLRPLRSLSRPGVEMFCGCL